MFARRKPAAPSTSYPLTFIIVLCFLLHSSVSFQVFLMPEFTQTQRSIFEFQYPSSANSTAEAKSEGQVCFQGNNQQSILDNNRNCVWKINVCEQTIRQISRAYFTSNTLVPSTIIQMFEGVAQSRPTTFPKPIAFQLSNGLNMRFAGISSPENFRQQLNSFLSKSLPYLNSQRIELNIVHPSKIQTALGALGLSSAIYEQLMIARTQLNPITASKRIVLVLHQKFFSAAVEYPTEGPAQVKLLQYFFGDSPQKKSMQLQGLIQDPENPLHFISRANYGRLLILSLDNSLEGTAKQIQKLYDCSSNVLFEYDCFANAMSELQSNPTLRYYFAGVEEQLPLVRYCEYCKPMVDWKRVFFPLNASTVQDLRPLNSEAISFSGQRYVQQQFRYFQSQHCQKTITIQITKIDEGNSLRVQYLRNRQIITSSIPRKVKQLFNETHPGTFQIGSEVGQDVFELKFIANGKRIPNGPHFFLLKNKPVYSIQVEFALLINGEKKISHIIGNSRSQNQFKGLTIRIDPQTQTSSILYLEKDNDEFEPRPPLRSGAPLCCDSTQFQA